MTWNKLEEQEPELYFNSDAKKVTDITTDINLVFDRMLENKEEDDAQRANELAFMINATSGTIDILWYDSKSEKFVGVWKYQLQLKNIAEMASKHKDGAMYFEDQCHAAICDFVEESILNKKANRNICVYTQYEGEELEELTL